MARSDEAPDVVVVGSLNLDISVPVPHLPAPGETVIGGDALWSPGGKGGNQAVAAARMGRSTTMIGALGQDSAGDTLLAGLRDDGVDFAGVRLGDVPTGVAAIAVAEDGSGENSIVVSPGANGRLTAGHVSTSPVVRAAGVVLVQFEVPLECVRAAIDQARGLVIVNPAPAVSGARAALAGADVVVPNRGELAALVGSEESQDHDRVVDQARSLEVGAVVVTLGSDGALVVTGDRVSHVPAVPVRPVDTTAAGDTFCGALADALLGQSPREGEAVDHDALSAAATWAAQAAAVTVTKRGAQASIPTRAEVVSRSGVDQSSVGPSNP